MPTTDMKPPSMNMRQSVESGIFDHNRFFETIAEQRGSHFERRLRFQMQYLYGSLPLRGARVLDIGGGEGLHSFYAVSRGAESAVILEPQGDGGDQQMNAAFASLKAALECDVVHLYRTRLQDYPPSEEQYDLIFIQDAINHFDERACISLRSSQRSREIYQELFHAIARLLRPGGLLSMSDCSSRNLFPAIGLKNPFDRNIEWQKHQPPQEWIKLAICAGLEARSIRWSSPSILGEVGKSIIGNQVGSWFFTSHFNIVFEKQTN